MGKILWLASYPKSGNTWTRAFLGNLFRDGPVAADINGLQDLVPIEGAIPHFTALEPKPWEAWTPQDVARLRAAAQARLAASRPHTVFCKTHLAVQRRHGHPTINMEVTAGAVYLVRNPLDVAVSYADHLGFSIDDTVALMALEGYETPSTSRLAAEPIGSWSGNVKSWTGRPNPGLHVMRYEDMLADPMTAFTGLASFLRLDAPRPRIERAVRNSSFKALRRQEELRGFREKRPRQARFFREGRAGQWREVLTAAQVAAVVEAHREQMERFGYLPEGM
jgi:hypothetical protein